MELSLPGRFLPTSFVQMKRMDVAQGESEQYQALIMADNID